ncbi:DUF2269 domain-containing protein [Pseudarthrobacter sp. H2]|uniref:DUF2269 domain-containing protein n=1 Tax=Pseudarthrobacter sp. H2 TaxID=3418415 RepID=UPI003CFBACCE
MMAPGLRKLALTIHVLSSVGWLGAVVSFLVLAVAGLTSTNPQLVRAAYLAMDLIGWFIIFPLSLASLLSGIVQALGTVWGLFRHYWVLIKLLITALASALLLLHLQPVTHMAGIASASDLSPAAMTGMRGQLVADAGAAVIALLVATVLSVYKPRGTTRWGRTRATAMQGPSIRR